MTFLDSQPVIITGEGNRLDYDLIVQMVQPETRVLDLGCGTGELMERLVRERNVLARGVDLHQPSVSECISKGLSVYHGDIHDGLADLRDQSFDYVILSRTLQQVPDPEIVIREMLRVGKYAIVSFPNFAFWRIRLHLLLKATLPISPALPYAWYNTPNIRLITMGDFADFCTKHRFSILATAALDTDNDKHPRQIHHLISWRAEYGIFLLAKAQ
ncbi:MAG TPA: methionine biosynthesis protein MetW [Armatimonadota bacterium]|nr:methionine biosynthesis protein MetW [Armatimonadota bacterium]